MGNYFSSSKDESVEIINETDHIRVIVTNSKNNDGEIIEKKNEHVTKTDEIIIKEDNESGSTSNVLNEDDEGVTTHINLETNTNYVIQKKNLKRKNKRKNKKKHLQ